MTKIKSGKIIKKLKEYYGMVNADLSYSNIFQLTIAVVLSAQTTDKQVNSVTPALFIKFPGFNSLSGAGIKEVEEIIKSVGLYRTKAKNIINLSKEVAEKYKNILPDEFNDLVKLPGIGRKSANVILSMGFGKAAFPVDTHIIRIANRLGFIKSNDPYKVEQILTQYLQRDDWRQAHLLLIKHGRIICKARKPLCSECPLNKLCDFSSI
jgi:endonuclease III